jgi:hypothetical protein
VPVAVAQPSASTPSMPSSGLQASTSKSEQTEPVPGAPGSDSSFGSPLRRSTPKSKQQARADCRREALEYAAHWQRLACLEVTAKFESTRALTESWAREVRAGSRSEDQAGQECLDTLAKRFGQGWVRDGKRDASEIERAKEKACLAERAVGVPRTRKSK